MDKQAQDYRKAQLNKIVKEDFFQITIKFHAPNEVNGGKTNFLSITNAEFDKIKELLTI